MKPVGRPRAAACLKCGANDWRYSQRAGRKTPARSCKPCHEKYRAAHRDRIRAQVRDNVRAWRQRMSPEERKARNRAYRQANRDRVRAVRLRWAYGITVDEALQMLANQGGTCALCPKPLNRDTMQVDHDHATGRVRGMLCVMCNTTLGKLEKLGTDWIVRAKVYGGLS